MDNNTEYILNPKQVTDLKKFVEDISKIDLSKFFNPKLDSPKISIDAVSKIDLIKSTKVIEPNFIIGDRITGD
jgi:hypothetical protein